jgi:hypothetical protein
MLVQQLGTLVIVLRFYERIWSKGLHAHSLQSKTEIVRGLVFE